MLNNSIKKYISNIMYNRVLFNHSLSKETSFKIGGPAEVIVFPRNYREISKITKIALKLEIPLTVLGGGSNTLIKDNGIKGIVMIISNLKLSNTIFHKSGKIRIIKISSGVNMQTVCAFSIKNSLLGTNFALGIPGTIGGAVAMNSGTKKGSISDILQSITVLDNTGEIKEISNPYNYFSKTEYYQKKTSTIILACKLKLIKSNYENIKQEAQYIIKKRNLTQPLLSNNAGCFFKNPKFDLSAGELIDKVGLKGKIIGGAMISKKHANFIINKNYASANDVLKLADLSRKYVYKYFKIILEPEVQIIGE